MKSQSVKVGDEVPKFGLKDQNGELVNIEKFLGKPFVVYFYPKDDTPGCTIEACSFRDAYEEFKDAGSEVIGICSDSPAAHKKFIEKYRLPFTLLSDEKNEVRKLFGVPKSFFGLLPGRVTYVIGKDGKIKHIFSGQLQMKQHVKEAIKHIQLLK